MLDEIKANIKTSLLAGDRFRAESLKMVQAALMNARIAKGAGTELTEEESIQVVQKEIKKRAEAADMYDKAGSADRAASERKEITILEEFVPKLIEGDELAKLVDEHLATLPADQRTFPLAMKSCIDNLGNINKGQLSGLLKTKLS